MLGSKLTIKHLSIIFFNLIQDIVSSKKILSAKINVDHDSAKNFPDFWSFYTSYIICFFIEI